jgi:hypothetical protein
MTSNETIAIRAYTVSKNQVPFKRLDDSHDKKYDFDRILVWDTETTTDLYQNLKFGYFKIYQYKILEHHGLFYDPLIIKGEELEIIQQFSKQNKITLYVLEQFREIFLHEVYDLQSLCVGFNLPFDLTRIAIKSTNARHNRKNGFSLVLSENLHYPRLHVTHITNTMAFIGFGSTKNKQSDFHGNFLDLRTLCHALTDKKHSLESACKYFKTKYQKQKTKEHGKITSQYIKYCINDVNATYSLYQATKQDFDSYELNIPITRIFTPATIGKEFLKKIGLLSFFEKNTKFPLEMIGKIMTCYIGGRTECKIRKTPTRVDVLDFLAMYPTVCTLQNLWKFVIADHIEYQEATNEITDFIEKFALGDIQKPENWVKLQGLVQIEPENDVLPIRSRYGQKNVWNIGISHVTSKTPLWYSIADVIASKLYTGRPPKILKAYKFIPVGVQENLKTIKIHGMEINPYKDDLFKKLVEYRQELKNNKDPKQQIIKIIVNAISYGIFVEINTSEESKKIPVDVYGLEHFVQSKTKIEKSGFMSNPIIAVSVTSASRLLLATTEILLSKYHATHAYCDTDSMMVPPKYTKEIQEFFQPLNPYNFDNKIFKVERNNVWFYGISSKRYCLYKMKNDKIKIKDDDYSSHGLGHLLDPFSNDPDEKNDWTRDIWYDILNLHYGKTTLEELYEKYQTKYALSKFMASNPRILGRLSLFNKNKDYINQFKPRNFCIIGFSNVTNPNTGKLIKPLTPFIKPARHAVFSDFVDYNDDSRNKLRGKQYWKSFWDVFLEYLNHPESKFDGDVGALERKHIVVTGVIHIGKESNNLEESEFLGVDSESYETYDDLVNLEKKFRKICNKILGLKPKDVVKFGISRQTFWNIKSKIRINKTNHISRKVKIMCISILSVGQH